MVGRDRGKSDNKEAKTDGRTPSKVAGICIGQDRNRWMSLIKLSVDNQKRLTPISLIYLRIQSNFDKMTKAKTTQPRSNSNRDFIQTILRQEERARQAFERLKSFDSMVFVEIPQTQIADPFEFRGSLTKIENKWLTVFNKNPPRYSFVWNGESGVNGYFGENYFAKCKLYRFDGTEEPYDEGDYRAKRGFLIRDHYDAPAVFRAHAIADNLIEFLKQEGISYRRFNFDRETRKQIEVPNATS